MQIPGSTLTYYPYQHKPELGTQQGLQTGTHHAPITRAILLSALSWRVCLFLGPIPILRFIGFGLLQKGHLVSPNGIQLFQ